MNQTYTVKLGDTLYGISNQYGVSVTELAQINNVDAKSLQIGQVLIIPSKSGTNPNNMFMYTVVKGDSLYKIAQKYNTTVDEIKKLNYLSSNVLQIGQIIRIPEMYTPEDEMYMPQYINYTVKKGDTIYSISEKFEIDPSILKKDNSLTSNTLNVGQNLKIRVTDEVSNVEECYGPDYTPPQSVLDNYTEYIVKKGDSLYKIANAYGTSVTNIVNLNNLKTNNLAIGQKLKIPVKKESNSVNTYIVKSGDSLYSIAKRFNTSVDDIKRKNNLKSNLLSIGQKLII